MLADLGNRLKLVGKLTLQKVIGNFVCIENNYVNIEREN